jgi:hypothetical protein
MITSCEVWPCVGGGAAVDLSRRRVRVVGRDRREPVTGRLWRCRRRFVPRPARRSDRDRPKSKIGSARRFGVLLQRDGVLVGDDCVVVRDHRVLMGSLSIGACDVCEDEGHHDPKKRQPVRALSRRDRDRARRLRGILRQHSRGDIFRCSADYISERGQVVGGKVYILEFRDDLDYPRRSPLSENDELSRATRAALSADRSSRHLRFRPTATVRRRSRPSASQARCGRCGRVSTALLIHRSGRNRHAYLGRMKCLPAIAQAPPQRERRTPATR